MATTLPPLGKSSSKKKMSQDDSRLFEGDNPFKLPNDDQIFRMREEARRTKEQDHKDNANLKIWEKTKKEVSTRTDRLKEIIGDEKLLTMAEASADEATKMVVPRRREKENTSDFVNKKREMFLVQMSLNTKREEIKKLEEKAQMKEEALQRSEQMLEEDAMRFDAFLKENDKKAHDAIKRAEEETKKKQEKNQEIKRLTQQIQALSSEMSKHKEALDDCLRYKGFLDKLTPPEWFEYHKKLREDKIAKMRQDKFEMQLKDWERMRRRLIEQHRKEVEAKKEQKKERNRRAGNRNKVEEEDEEEEPESKLQIPPPPKLEEVAIEVPPEEEVPMYFTDPQQLMDIFSALEEQNLFLIQNSQETEHTLEELQHAFAETRITMDQQTGSLQLQIDDLNQQISNEDSRAKLLLSKRLAASETDDGSVSPAKDKTLTKTSATSAATSRAGGGIQNQAEKDKLLNDLNLKVRRVYEECKFDASSKPSTLFMLSQMESKLEALLQDIERMPQDYVIAEEKAKEKKRRERKRLEQQALQVKQQEERNRRAIERSMQAPKKRSGRQVMYRSRPIRTEQATTGDDDADQNINEEMKFLS